MPFPKTGPYDKRLGYVDLPSWIERLVERGYRVESQARLSPALSRLAHIGIFPIYREKLQSGLQILDRHGKVIFRARYPERVYRSFEAIPPIVLKTLLFIENRELLNFDRPYQNPALDWSRLAKVSLDMALSILDRDRKVAGASTLATQLEKYRHSPDGLTQSVPEKLRQMVSASLRAYLDGRDTRESRRKIVLNYINSIPLAAIQGYGEVNGLGDGLWAWFGSNFEDVTRLLSGDERIQRETDIKARAMAYRQVLSLLLAHRRPSYYLIEDQQALHSLTDMYLRLLAREGIISSRLKEEALKVKPVFRGNGISINSIPFSQWKAANSIRLSTLSLLSMERLYDLDRLDLTIGSTLDKDVQEELTEYLRQLQNPEVAQAAGLVGFRLLEKGDPSKVIYSFTLYERTRDANLLRIQTDNFDGPFNINEGIKLDLGSTAKLRTLVHYLEIVADLHRRLSGLSQSELRSFPVHPSDKITQWAVDYVSNARDLSLMAMLEAAMERRYSASPAERFFTGGGLHTFENFNKEDNHKILSVREGFRDSVNLVFIRLMRDIVNHCMLKVPGSSAHVLERTKDPERLAYLYRFADREGKIFLRKFYNKYKGKGPDEAFELLLHGLRPSPIRLMTIFRSVKPEASVEESLSFLRSRLPNSNISEKTVKKLYETYSPQKFDLSDRGYLAHVHPLELWTVAYLYRNPGASLTDIIKASTEERREVYRWLFKEGRLKAQNTRIRTILEIEAFQEIHRAWKRLGYPFDFLVPSYATAIGSSADRPAALTELVGIILNGGIRKPMVRIEWLHFAQGTPYETILRRKETPDERVLPPEIAWVVKRALMDVVGQGTARRAHKAFVRSDGGIIPVGGKTGTGDHRYEVYGPGGRLISSRVLNRTATFVFTIGDRFFGTITAYVSGPDAATYAFTSSLPVQLLKVLAPKIMPLVEGKSNQGAL